MDTSRNYAAVCEVGTDNVLWRGYVTDAEFNELSEVVRQSRGLSSSALASRLESFNE